MPRLPVALALAALVASPVFAAPPCKDAKGKFVKCPPAAAVVKGKDGKCRVAAGPNKGKFTKCP
ncbi:hypothetical protein PQ455_16835 [Sphingomonas naphthae]|uniref:DUF2282 domain-containing protein n=1 Tax=Sphingomonas naphthae TaxID=1813468 RepID=A0ABY7TJ53_9SPHN|nr:hypothetical protein [Sphingomonas naphthae]WCT73262.1 hypothetical protein PQ455_16835 [Sphingomonas naphthae]